MNPESQSTHLLQVVADSLTILLEPGSFAGRASAFLHHLGAVVDADRAYYFEINAGTSPLTCSQRFEWVREGISQELHNPLLQNLCCESVFPRMLAELSAGRAFSTLTQYCEMPLREILAEQNVRSLAVVPVHSRAEFIGFIGFDACRTERIWKDGEIESLRAAAAGLGSAILRHKMEESMAARAEELARSRRVALSLMEDAQRAVEASEQASMAKSAFLAMMSHEIRTPLNGVIGFTDLLLEENLPPHQAELVSTIRSCGNSLLGLINDILDLSKIESGRLELEMLPCVPRECLREILASFGAAVQSKNLSVTCDVAETVPTEVLTDPKRLRQILFNLVGNAIKFTHEGGISVSVSASSTPGGRMLLDCEVADTGIGIAKGEQEKIFEAFGQADASIHRRYGGTGLGLAICRRLVDAMGGTISVKSEAGAGTSFRFTIPVYRIQQPSIGASSGQAGGMAEISGLQVLAVDDVSTNIRLMSGILKRLGCIPSTALDGREAALLAEQHAYDVIFMDVLMPVCDGLEATRMIREFESKNPARRPAYIVALTADAFAENKKRCLDAGMDEFLTKPLRIDLIRAAIVRGATKSAVHAALRHSSPLPVR